MDLHRIPPLSLTGSPMPALPRLILLLAFGFLALTIGASKTAFANDADAPVFERDILPIFKSRCTECHNAQAVKGGLDLSTMAGVRKGGESGESAIVESLDESMLWIMIESGDMPPEGEEPLLESEKEIVRRWISTGAKSTSTESETTITQHDVLPYLYTRCVVCHGARQQEADLDLRTVESILKGGKSGPVVVPGKPEESLILKRIHAKDMPPPKELIRAGVRPMESSEIDLLTRWIAQGAIKHDITPDAQTETPDSLVSDDDRKFWAFQSPVKPNVPESEVAPIDYFIQRKLREQNLTPSPEAERLTLIRRVAFDLTGLPPQWNDVERFLNDDSKGWYAKVVDYYLASPHYGERWGRYWLDVAGYADSEGKRSADPVRSHAWRYRDYVIRSLNDDKPYDRFLLEQLAGDELYDFENADAITDKMMDSLVATGFLRMVPDGTGSDIVDTVAERFEVVADEIEVLGSSVMGLTLRCAQCHSHKYDPIPQRDYYRLVSVFQGAYDVYDWLKPTSVSGQSKQKNPTRRYLTHVSEDTKKRWQKDRRPIEKQIATAQKELVAKEAEFRTRFVDEQLKDVSAELHDDLRTMLKTSKKERTPRQLELAKNYEASLTVSAADLVKKYSEFKSLKTASDKRIKELQATLPAEPMIRALWDRGEPSPTWIFRRGEFTNPGDLVGPGVPSVLTDGKTPFVPTSQRPGSTGRRLAFAKWLTEPSHPLTARVIVNRIWFHHFGRGIVESLGNFGQTGVAPTHPELLDWLAVSFVENGWSFKWLHRQIMLSRTWRQSSTLRPESEERDSDNRWLSRMPLRRLEAEPLRDSLLAASGQLDITSLGEPDAVTIRADGLVTAKRSDAGWRRTVYVQQRRSTLPSILETFDLPQMNPNCVERPDSTVASQALHLLNNGMVRDLTVKFAQRIERKAGDDRYRQVEHVYQDALSRKPTSEETQLALEALSQLTAEWEARRAESVSKPTNEKESPSVETKALANFCHVIMNSAEFLFVD
ncbi:MAG: PSD1 and planctomycete cytochrome C domain-containing protein [Planctomycetota bacterium]|nr:PSD1 and planctomycete cytochrome C domain-containing protein [Planctomycetota bacterium]MDA0920458.1 PSD1 and planctomycete cytochrome C domain-containing protein [Planctomycetota bacterium]